MREVSNRKIYWRLLRYLRPYRGLFALSLLSMVVYGATDGVLPYILKRVLDDIFGNQDRSMLNILVGAILTFALVRGLFSFLQRYLIAIVGLRIVRDMRNEIHNKLLLLSPAFFENSSSADLITRMTNDTLQVRSALTDAVASVLRDSIRVISLLIAAIFLDPLLAVLAFIGFPIALLPVVRFGRKVRRLSGVGQEQFGGLTGVLQEMVLGHKVVQAFRGEKFEKVRFEEENQKLTETFERAEKYGALSGPTNEMVASLATAAVILYGGYSVMSGVRTQGDFIAFLTTVFLLYEPLRKIGRVNSIVQMGMAAAVRIFEVMDTKPDIVESPNALILPRRAERIEFRDVYFRYQTSTKSENHDEGRPWVLENVSLVIEPGQMIALVGSSGGGKTTLAHLLLRFYDPQRGSISIGGHDLKDCSLDSLRGAISLVGQHTFLFDDTVLQNIAYGKLNATREEIVAAARAAFAEGFINELPQGFDTVVGEQGFRLSGGQRARIAIARALLKDAPILVLDEATASLDSESEQVVQDAIDRLMKDRTVLVIAHRLATIQKADSIAVIVGGRIVEHGTHSELFQRGGEYSKLYRLQFRDESTSVPKVSNDF